MAAAVFSFSCITIEIQHYLNALMCKTRLRNLWVVVHHGDTFMPANNVIIINVARKSSCRDYS